MSVSSTDKPFVIGILTLTLLALGFSLFSFFDPRDDTKVVELPKPTPTVIIVKIVPGTKLTPKPTPKPTETPDAFNPFVPGAQAPSKSKPKTTTKPKGSPRPEEPQTPQAPQTPPQPPAPVETGLLYQICAAKLSGLAPFQIAINFDLSLAKVLELLGTDCKRLGLT